jgi:hypothetical protein
MNGFEGVIIVATACVAFACAMGQKGFVGMCADEVGKLDERHGYSLSTNGLVSPDIPTG